MLASRLLVDLGSVCHDWLFNCICEACLSVMYTWSVCHDWLYICRFILVAYLSVIQMSDLPVLSTYWCCFTPDCSPLTVCYLSVFYWWLHRYVFFLSLFLSILKWFRFSQGPILSKWHFKVLCKGAKTNELYFLNG